MGSCPGEKIMSNFNFTTSQLAKLLPGNTHITEWFSSLNKFLPVYNIDTLNRVAAFIAQTSHESANYTTLKENLNYGAQGLANTWPTRFAELDSAGHPIKPITPNKVANDIQRQPEVIANFAYSNRMGNGDVISGDGWRYRGQGLIQLTGKDNQSRFATAIKRDLSEMEDYLSSYDGAVESACWFWNDHLLNPLADLNDITSITKKINGGVIGLDERIARYNTAKGLICGF